MTQYYAHSGQDVSIADGQKLSDHLNNTAQLAEKMGNPFGLAQAAYIAALLHDLGKYNPAFQKRLMGDKTPVDHSTAGAQVLHQLAVTREQKKMADVISYAIMGHHAGLPDRIGPTAASFDNRMKKPIEIDPIWKKEIAFDLSKIVPDMMSCFPKDDPNFSKAFTLAFMGRMIFSCLVDADYKETEAFYAGLENRQIERDWPQLQDKLAEFTNKFDKTMFALADNSSALNSVRSEILTAIRAKATEKPGLFTLTVPTGGGKTLASLGFALDHAKAHGHNRIIYAIPYTSIIDQTAKIFRSVLGEDYVLEHHSAIEIQTAGKNENEFSSRDKLKLAMEDWAAPIVVTTNVQLFESLFSAKPSRARKLHNIANAVIVLDEAQMLPRSLLLPTMQVLKELTERYGCSIILCTATQPALGKRDGFPRGLNLDGRELAPSPASLAEKLARATVRMVGDMDNAALIDALRSHEQAFVIVNSRPHALELYQQAKTAGLEGLIHLSTRQYASHRMAVLADIRSRLANKKPCRLIATSLIEAGVDLDFPVGFRARAGLEQIIQAAGRVNREGRKHRDDCFLNVFTAPNHAPPNEIQGVIKDMEQIARNHENLTSLAAIAAYFTEVYWRSGDDQLDAKKILKKFEWAIISGSNFAYREVSDIFRFIESDMLPVIIARDETAKKAVDQLSFEKIPSGKIARDLQSYVVQVPPNVRKSLLANGEAAFVAPHVRADQFAVLQKANLYNDEVGLWWERAGEIFPEDCVQ